MMKRVSLDSSVALAQTGGDLGSMRFRIMLPGRGEAGPRRACCRLSLELFCFLIDKRKKELVALNP
jgi:hypothetical protein